MNDGFEMLKECRIVKINNLFALVRPGSLCAVTLVVTLFRLLPRWNYVSVVSTEHLAWFDHLL